MFEKCIYFNIAALNRKITNIWQESFLPLGLSPSHAYLLIAISENPDVSQKELGQLMELDPSTITRFIDTLERKGMLEKTARGKGSTLKISSKGQKVSRKIKKTMKDLFARMEKHFGKKEFPNFVNDIYTARQSFEEKE